MKRLRIGKLIVSFILVAAVMMGATNCDVARVEKIEKNVEVEKNKEDNTKNNRDNTTKDNTRNEVEKISSGIGKIKVQDDFYGYVNKERLMSYELNDTKARFGAFGDVQKQVEQEILEMVKATVVSDKKFKIGSNQWVVKNVYYQLMDYLEYGRSSAKEDFEQFTKRVWSISNRREALKMLGELKMEHGVFDLFGLGVQADLYDSNKNAVYIWQNNAFFETEVKNIYEDDSIRKRLNKYIVDMLVMSGKKVKDAKKLANQYLYYLVDVACETNLELENVENRYATLTYFSNKELDKKLENITIEEIVKGLEIQPSIEGFYVQDVCQLNAILKMMDGNRLDLIRTYLICTYINRYKMFLLENYEVLNAYTSKYSIDNERGIVEILVEILSSQISEMYADEYFTAERKSKLLEMQKDITKAYEKVIWNADWLSQKGKERLLQKLHNMKFIYGGGAHCLTEKDNKAVVGKDFYTTYKQSRIFAMKSLENKIGKHSDWDVSDMTSNTVNAQYIPSNVFTVTVGIMHAPFFDGNASKEENLGGLGMIIGHEMGHAFDSNCISFDQHGNYREGWLPKKDCEELKKRLTEIERYYSDYTVMDIYHVDGKQTAAENYADLGAMECLMQIITDCEGRKKLFENYAKIWEECVEDIALVDAIAKDEHSPSMIRVNAVLSSMQGFYETYDIKVGDKMYVAPEKRVSRW